MCVLFLPTDQFLPSAFLSPSPRMAVRVLMITAALLSAVIATAALPSPAFVTVAVHLRRQHSEEAIEAAFVARSAPGTSSFRHHLTVSALTQLVGAAEGTVSIAQQYLRLRGVTDCHVHVTRDVLECHVAQHAAPSVYELLLSARPSNGAPRWAAPDAFSQAVSARAIIVRSPIVNKEDHVDARRRRLTEPGMLQTPYTIRQRYGVPAVPPSTPLPFAQGVGEFEGEFFTTSDMSTFTETYGLPNSTVRVIGPNVAGGDNIEGTLDLQYMLAMTGAANYTTWWLAQSGNNNDPGNIDFSAWCNKVIGIPQFPAVVSISWGMGDYRYGWQPAVMVADNDAFRKLGLLGVSVLVASGDSGPGVRGLSCSGKFMPSWPASSPYVTSVGATYSTEQDGHETAVDWSGGGFSDTFAMPQWQRRAAEEYFRSASKALPIASRYNASGRGYPDVAALGTNFQVFVGGQWTPVSGTSCASPTFAGIVSTINAERLNTGLATLGFLNPVLYQSERVGFDIESGASVDTDCFGLPVAGFPAWRGWDAVTGWGTPDYSVLRSVLLRD